MFLRDILLAAEETLVPTAENESEYRHIEVLEEEEDGENEEVDGEERDKENEQRRDRRETTGNKIKVKLNGKAMTEFKCTLCGQTYKNFYAKAAKSHDEERGGVCPLKKMLEKGITVPEKESLLKTGILMIEKKKKNSHHHYRLIKN